MTESEKLAQAMAALEAQRALLGDAVVEAALGPLREKLAALTAPPPPRGGQRKTVTILFADISGFTAMAERMDAEDLSTAINSLWQHLDEAITFHGGYIAKHIGDAVMAMWGTGDPRADDPERAIHAALVMQKELADFRALIAEMEAFSRPISQTLHASLSMRIGIHTGPVLLSTMGLTGEWTAIGEAVNIAAHLEQTAPVGGIHISQDTYQLVQHRFDVSPHEPLPLQDRHPPLQKTYVVQRARPGGPPSSAEQ
jgi:class 3 adenylate cyclase